MVTPRQRSRAEDRIIVALTTVVFTLIALPLIAIVGALSLRLFRWLAG